MHCIIGTPYHELRTVHFEEKEAYVAIGRQDKSKKSYHQLHQSYGGARGEARQSHDALVCWRCCVVVVAVVVVAVAVAVIAVAAVAVAYLLLFLLLSLLLLLLLALSEFIAYFALTNRNNLDRSSKTGSRHTVTP